MSMLVPVLRVVTCAACGRTVNVTDEALQVTQDENGETGRVRPLHDLFGIIFMDESDPAQGPVEAESVEYMDPGDGLGPLYACHPCFFQ